MSEITQHANFDEVRYSQVWEDADVLAEAIRGPSGARYLSVASAGDNALALLLLEPEAVVALDLSPTQIYCVELRVAAIKELTHTEFLQLMGARPSDDRQTLFDKIKSHLTTDAIAFWRTQTKANTIGYGHIGKFERYFTLFRRRILPLIHSKKMIDALLAQNSIKEMETFYDERWNTWRWRLLFRLFFSRTMMGKLGRDPAFFKYVEGSVATRIFSRAEHALRNQIPNKNPYLHWILKGHYGDALPLAWREEHFQTLKENIDKLEYQTASIEEYLAKTDKPFNGFNLSDIFEYMNKDAYTALLKTLLNHSAADAKLVYWNMLAPRTRPESLASQLQPLTEQAEQLHEKDKAFFYSRLVIEQKIG